MGDGAPRRILTVIGAALVALGTGVGPAAAEGDLGIEADAVYRLVPEDARLEVTVEFVLTNQKPSTTSGYVTTQYYFDRFGFIVPDEASDIVAMDAGGRVLDLDDEYLALGEDEILTRVVTAHFPRRVYYRGEQVIRLSFHLPGGEPRSNSTVRANPAYAAFPAWAWGDPGLSTVSIVIPNRFDVDYAGDDLDIVFGDTETTWMVDEVGDPHEWYVYFTARDDSALEVESIEVAGLTVTVRAWPGDAVWGENVAEVVRLGLPALQQAVGLDFGDQATLDIIETIDPTLLGYAGWYLTDEDVIEMGEELDDHIVLHEISHLWFNSGLFAQRWITEGLAEEYASDAVDAIDGDSSIGTGPLARPDRTADEAVALNRWVLPRVPPSESEEVADREDYGYHASFWIIRTLRDQIGPAAMRAVLQGAADDLTAYRVQGDPETVDATDGWRRFLDLLEEVGGSTDAEVLFREFVVSTEDLPLLDERAEARESYAELVTAAGDWDTPWVIREAMGEWEFAAAEDDIFTAMRVVSFRDQIADAAADLGLEPPAVLEETFEGATTSDALIEATVIGDRQLATVREVAEARTAVDFPRGLFAKIGLIGEDPEADYDEAAAAFESGDDDAASAASAEVVALILGAESVGQGRVLWTGGSLVLLLGGGAGVWLLVRRRRAATASTPENDLLD